MICLPESRSRNVKTLEKKEKNDQIFKDLEAMFNFLFQIRDFFMESMNDIGSARKMTRCLQNF